MPASGLSDGFRRNFALPGQYQARTNLNKYAVVVNCFFVTGSDRSGMESDVRSMKLDKLLEGLNAKQMHGLSDWPVVTDLTDDSRLVTPGSLFIARKGAGGLHGSRFLPKACKAGCVAVVSDAMAEIDVAALPDSLPVIGLPECDAATCSHLASRFFDDPSHKLNVLAVTGTNGKTTVAWWMKYLLESTGVKTGLIGTIVTDVGTGPAPASLTTPGPIELQRLLAEMVGKDCQAVACEFSSHALDQGRTAGIDVDAAVFTNLTGDHLDYHGSMEAYADAKAKLFEGLKPDAVAVVNSESPYSQRMLRDCQAKVVATRIDEDEGTPDTELASEDSVAHAKVLHCDVTGCEIELKVGNDLLRLTLPVIGRHNVMNALQAFAAVHALDRDQAIAQNLIERLTTLPAVPGRLERVGVDWPVISAVEAPSDEKLPTVLVDYAHTDDALRNVLQALRAFLRDGQRLWVVFGCGGDRDRTKRPRMAEVAHILADSLVVTSDNPRTEEPLAIIDDILKGLPTHESRKPTQILSDRAEAIDWVIQASAEQDVILIAGKGHEDYQILGKEKHHFDDREQVRESLRQRSNKGAR